MGRTLFIDVGGHEGQTLAEVLSDRYRFDQVHCFEPMPVFAERLAERFAADVAAGRLVVHRRGLSDTDGTFTLYGANIGGGASLFADKKGARDDRVETQCSIQKASDFVRGAVADDDLAIMKLNCEGAEGAILTDLIDSGQIFRLAEVMIDFDMLKIPGLRREPARILSKLREIGFDRYSLCGDVMIGADHGARIRNWLAGVPNHERFFAPGAIASPPKRRSPVRRLIARARGRL